MVCSCTRVSDGSKPESAVACNDLANEITYEVEEDCADEVEQKCAYEGEQKCPYELKRKCPYELERKCARIDRCVVNSVFTSIEVDNSWTWIWTRTCYAFGRIMRRTLLD